MKNILILFFISSTLLFATCKKGEVPNVDCILPAVVPFQPYSFPIWHPNGNIIGFNYTPLAGIGTNGTSPCIWYSYSSKPDSTGFYIMNKNGTGLRRITNFHLFAPAWSPNGNWIAFSKANSQLYKMPFDGINFDTANILQLTNGGGNFHPSWTANNDTIYFDSNNTLPTGSSFYTIWKMASNDGSGKQRIIDASLLGDIRFPSIASNLMVYYVRGFQGKGEIFSMNKDGSNQLLYSNNGFGVEKPKYWQGKVFYEANQIGVVNTFGSAGTKLTSPAVTYDISINGEIVYSRMDYSITTYNKQIGTLWIMNADGTNNHQLTFNNF
jgi:Tol biopolymer transport system component